MAKIYGYANAENFLDLFEKLLIEQFADNLDKLIILMPSGHEVSKLQFKLSQSFAGGKLLPKILPFYELSKHFSGNLTEASNLNERFLLVNILAKWQKNRPVVKAINAASEIHGLLSEFIAQGLSPNDVSHLKEPFTSEGWQEIQAELCQIYQEFLSALRQHNITSTAEQINLSINNLFSLIENNPGRQLLICPGMLYNQHIKEIILKSLQMANCTIVLQQINSLDDYSKDKSNPICALLPEHCHVNNLEPEFKPILPSLIDAKSSIINSSRAAITVIESADIFVEADIIARHIVDFIANQPRDVEIALVINNSDIKPIITSALKKLEIAFNDQMGRQLKQSNIFNLFREINNIVTGTEFCLQNLIWLLQHPFLSLENDEAKQLANKLASKADYISTLHDCLEYTNDLPIAYGIIEALNKQLKEGDTAGHLQHATTILARIVPAVPQEEENFYLKLIEVIDIINNTKREFSLKTDLDAIIDNFIAKQLVMLPYDEAMVNIINPDQLGLQKYDLVMATNLTVDTLPIMPKNSAWLGYKAIEKLELQLKDCYQRQLYIFFLLLQRSNIILSFARQDHLGQTSLPSPFLEKLKFIDHENNIKWVKAEDNNKYDISNKETTSCAVSSCFPNRISASSVELLLKAPYNFYANKILGLKKIDAISEELDLAKFGSILHEALEIYTKNYQQQAPDKVLIFNDICQKVIEKSTSDTQLRYIIAQKMQAIAKEFIAFDEERRLECRQILAEISGSIKLDILKRKIEITAIADRIEVSKAGEITILDYKTGTPPSLAEVKSGMAPQLVVEAIIASKGGFTGLAAVDKCKIIYVKIAANQPRIITSELILTSDDIAQHLKGLEDMLEFYLAKGEYASEHMISRFDDYSHLARRDKLLPS